MELVVPFAFAGKDHVKVYRYHGGEAAALSEAAVGVKKDGTFRTDTVNGLIYIYASQFSTYAIGYTVEEHTVTFDGGSGTEPVSIKTKSDGTLAALPGDPQREGYTFSGWYTEKGEKVTENTVFKADAAVTAHWTKKDDQSVSSSGSSGSGGGSGSGYTVRVPKTSHGKVSVNRTNAAAGSAVTLTVKPDTGYRLDALSVTDSQGNALAVSEKGGSQYVFVMPRGKVSIQAVFAAIPGETAAPCDGGAGCPTHRFADLNPGSWYHEAVDYALENGLMNGYNDGLFKPGSNLSRAQLAQILYNMEGRPAVDGGSAFADVKDGSWCASAVSWTNRNGIAGGYGDGRFGPNDAITREQLAVMLWRYAGSPSASSRELGFTDAGTAGAYALDALHWAAENGIIGGFGDGSLRPKGLATRAQTAQMLMWYRKCAQG